MLYPALRGACRIHPSAIIGHPPEHRDWPDGSPGMDVEIADDARVGAYCTVDAGMLRRTTVGPRSWLMKRVHLGHDVVIGADCELAPGVTVGGEVTIGDGVRVGVNACIRPRVTIGDCARLGCGAVVVCDVPAGEVWAGNPARPLRKAAVGPRVSSTVDCRVNGLMPDYDA